MTFIGVDRGTAQCNLEKANRRGSSDNEPRRFALRFER